MTISSRASLTPLTGEQPVVLGVASDIARRLRLDPIAVRLAFLTLAVAGGVGVALYLVLWLLNLPGTPDQTPRSGERSRLVGTFGLVTATAGMLLVIRQKAPGFADQVVWPTALVASGLMLAWHQLLPSGASEDSESSGGTMSVVVRVGGGTVLLAAGLSFLLAANLSIGAARDAIMASAAVAGGVLLMFGPWVIRLAQSASHERTQRIRADERAEMAVHLHDSVLQTLTLMQKQASDPAAMASLARRQERELRRWLYGPGDPFSGTERRDLAEELEHVVGNIEDTHLIRVETVTVGNALMSESMIPLVAATREALINAAKFSGERQVSLYAQVNPDAVEVYVRDRGRGFDRALVPDDRRGLTESIEGRIHRAGGTATVKSAPGEGTEIHLRVRRPS